MKVRFFFLFFFLTLFYGALGWKLYTLQIQKGEIYKAKAESISQKELELRRGQIFITNKDGSSIQVAFNKDYPFIFADPKNIKDSVFASEQIANAFNLDGTALEKAFQNKNNQYKALIDKATTEQVNKAYELDKLIDGGLEVSMKQYRFYPFENQGSHFVGFVGMNENVNEPKGLYGIEKFYNEKLTIGEDLQLTIDKDIQSQAEKTLSKFIDNTKAVGGTVIVEDPITGKILAIANKPDFDPNNYSDFPTENYFNFAVASYYEPGSVIKPFTMAAGIDSGVISPTTTYTDFGSLKISGKTIQNANEKVYGKITMTEVIENSVNTGAVFAEQAVGNQHFFEYIKNFGFMEKTGIDLPDEIPGSLKNLQKKNAPAIDFATASYGQGIAVTPIELVNAFSAIANGGLLMRPYLNNALDPKIVRRVVDKETTDKVTKMLESAVKKNKIAVIQNYSVAGKTGTALIPKNGAYTDEMMHTYVGFAPASNPKFVILVKLDKPQVGELAGITVVPAFREIAEFMLNYYAIPPDELGVNDTK